MKLQCNRCLKFKVHYFYYRTIKRTWVLCDRCFKSFTMTYMHDNPSMYTIFTTYVEGYEKLRAERAKNDTVTATKK